MKKISTSVLFLAHHLFSLTLKVVHPPESVDLCGIKAKGREFRSFTRTGVAVAAQVLYFRAEFCITSSALNFCSSALARFPPVIFWKAPRWEFRCS